MVTFLCPYRVQPCAGTGYVKRGNLFRHISSSHRDSANSDRYSCPTCSTLMRFETWDAYKDHLIRFHFPEAVAEDCVRMFEHVYCPYVPCANQIFHSEPYMLRHVRSRHKDAAGRYFCPVCHQIVPAANNLFAHLRTQHPRLTATPVVQRQTSNVGFRTCPLKAVCNRADFVDTHHLGSHLTMAHLGSTDTLCGHPDCNIRVFQTHAELVKHIGDRHNVRCGFQIFGNRCNEIFESWQDLLKHQAIRHRSPADETGPIA